MINLQCDICKKKTINFDTLVLQTKTINYCEDCVGKAIEIKKKFKQEIECQNILYNNALKRKEKEILKEIKE